MRWPAGRDRPVTGQRWFYLVGAAGEFMASKAPVAAARRRLAPDAGAASQPACGRVGARL
jgi:hypothetical protein